MVQVVTFGPTFSLDTLERDINDWFSNNPKAKYIDLKYQNTQKPGLATSYSAMLVVFKE